MRDLHDFLSEREIYILENHPDKPYAKLASELDITANRVGQIKRYAERKIREEKSAEARRDWGNQPLQLTLKRSDWLVIRRALNCYSGKLTPNNVRKRINPKYVPDPDIAACNRLVQVISSTVNEIDR